MKAKTSITERLSTPENVTLVTDWLAGNKDKTRTELATDMCDFAGTVIRHIQGFSVRQAA